MRLPNVFTAMADIFMGYWLTHETLSPIGIFLLLLTSSSCLYTAGMVLNDVYDLEIDRSERPGRPLPSGQIPAQRAGCLGAALLVIGMVLGGWASAFGDHDWRPDAVVAVLTTLILAYNRWLKRTVFGPVIMGACRACNVLFGMTTSPKPWTAANWLVACGMGLYIAGLTLFAQGEARTSRRRVLAVAIAIFLGGIAAMCIASVWMPPKPPPQVLLRVPFDANFPIRYFGSRSWSLIWLLLAAMVGWRFVRAIIDPVAVRVQAAVKGGILSIIVLDALVVLTVRGPLPAITTLVLLIPSLLLGRWIYST
jgi:4-hydroxybenzoate polyprenyltransferase